jgi:hypothetical protein
MNIGADKTRKDCSELLSSGEGYAGAMPARCRIPAVKIIAAEAAQRFIVIGAPWA